ncbi:hypothetical protein MPSEU_000388500 [Mayamaea pseudoterrestris]|nr:hypothetical protein MPSEU_000388500 [Mayamaea pseudoterrestris]
MADTTNEEPVVAAATSEEETAAAADGAAAANADGDDHHPEEENTTAHFEPVVQLEEVEVTSGEEEENVCYSQRAKLFVFKETMLDKGTGNKQWVERGVGLLKILQHKEHGKIRVLMRQEKTMKIIVNHLLIPGLKLVSHENNDRAVVWRANDFAEGEVLETDFCIRFGNSDIANAFKENFTKYQDEMQKVIDGADVPGADGGAAADEAAAALEKLTTTDDAAPAAEESTAAE